MRASRKWLARTIVALDLLVSCAIVFTEPASLLHSIVTKAGPTGKFALAALALVALAALIDVLVNDMLPQKYVLQCAIRHRHLIYMLISLGCLSMVFVIIKVYGPTVILLHYLLVAGAATIIALFDVVDRVKERHP